MTKKILVVGSINKDLTLKVKKAPAEGETIIGKELLYFDGGKGANQTIALSRMNADVSFIGKTGFDNYGYECLENLVNEQVDMPLDLKSENFSTGCATIILEENGNNRIIVIPGANDDYSDEDLEKVDKILDFYDYILIQLEINLEFTFKLIQRAHKKGKYIILNPAPFSKIPEDIIKKVSLVVPNEHEFEDFIGKANLSFDEIISEGKKLSTQLKNNWLITCGEKGSIFIEKDNVIIQKPFKVNAVDSTAAGDTFIGAFLSRLLIGQEIDKSLSFASKAAAITVSKSGAQISIPKESEVLESNLQEISN